MGTAAKGINTKIALNIDGVTFAECDIDNFSVTTETTDMEFKPLGKTTTDTDTTFEKYTGSLRLIDRDGSLDTFEDAYLAGVVTGAPLSLLIFQTILYPNGTERTYVYSDVRVNFSSNFERGSFNLKTYSWMSGTLRALV